ncbi:hypothetical protein HK097_009199 [Rhizophlyctis rosea]|uniref:Uncharacterized protein n=1 Tax=Rhizophlyctis rosea TaxID=64517 RepID=A0AAD5X415_9FUNG|nr:hypothetical protein HK097_009199 [Rhizophlyctis rosea]
MELFMSRNARAIIYLFVENDASFCRRALAMAAEGGKVRVFHGLIQGKGNYMSPVDMQFALERAAASCQNLTVPFRLQPGKRELNAQPPSGKALALYAALVEGDPVVVPALVEDDNDIDLTFQVCIIEDDVNAFLRLMG